MQLQHSRCKGSLPTAAAAPWALPPAACIARPVKSAQRQISTCLSKNPVAAPSGMHRSAADRHNAKRGQRLGSLPRGEGVPDDAHHVPQETPEQWLIAQEPAEHTDLPKQPQQQQGAASHQRKLTVPYLGLEVTPELVAISMVYFVQGILGLSRLALSFFFKDDLGVEPAQVAVLTGLAGLPWVVKPLYGFISDSIPLFGYRRRSYLLLCGLAGSVSWLSLATLVHSPTAAVGAMLLGSLSTACSDVVVDSLVVERARGEPAATAGSLQSLCWGSSAVGGIMSAYFSGSLVEQYGSTTVFVLTAVFPLIVSASALLIDEQRIPARRQAAAAAAGAPAGDLAQWQQPKQQQRQEQLAIRNASSSSVGSSWSSGLVQQLVHQGGALWVAVKQKHILLPTVFVFLWQATPTADTAMFYFYTNELHFTPEFLGRVRLAGSIASLAGVALYNGVFKSVPLKKMLLGAMLLGVALGSTQLLLVSGANRTLGLSDELFVLGDSVILTVLGQVSFMPILVLAARLCPEGVEATLFATLMSILNGGSFVGSALGAGLTAYLGVSSTDFSNLFLLVLLCNFSTLLPAPFLGLLPASLEQEGLPGSAAAAAATDADSKQQLASSSIQQGPASRSKHKLSLKTETGSRGRAEEGRQPSSSDAEDGEAVPLTSGQRK